MNQEQKVQAFKERKDRKLERYEYLANKRREESREAYNMSNKMASVIPFGQPVLVGHHSEGRHRNHIKRIGGLMNKAVKLSAEADTYESRLESAKNNNIISSDDPEAIIKLKAKLEKLEAYQTEVKRIKKEFKKVQDLNLIEMSDSFRKEAESNINCWGRSEPFPSYVLTNNNGNMRRIKQRIIGLERQQEIKPSVEDKGDLIVIRNTDLNRVQLKFEGKPSEEIRTILKRWGFRWSPYNGVWQRQLNNAGLYSAERVCELVKEALK